MRTNPNPAPLIKVEQNPEGTQVVSARELHKFLEASERFASWCERMFDYGFVENQDFVGCKVFNTQAKQELQDYALTLDCAKQIAMLQRNDKGKEARLYFIACERVLLAKKLEGLKEQKPMPHVARAYEIGLKLGALQAEQEELKKELAVLHSLPHYCRYCGKENKNYLANQKHEHYCSQNPQAAKSNLPAAKQKGGDVC